jgi:hypothetical protein
MTLAPGEPAAANVPPPQRRRDRHRRPRAGVQPTKGEDKIRVGLHERFGVICGLYFKSFTIVIYDRNGGTIEEPLL